MYFEVKVKCIAIELLKRICPLDGGSKVGLTFSIARNTRRRLGGHPPKTKGEEDEEEELGAAGVGGSKRSGEFELRHFKWLLRDFVKAKGDFPHRHST